ncbi:UNKNOWN [Stylonychia lemnae]|uniref:Uncharacterized protein n=1 Tax=Stylonychia lemnae TaxID=5949 RepID=A0A078A213_STYLE|nr:UNKNOWN [Stylonychia lemnae]|eukprot:CDW76271.1 UNKNOWN [Stylonychia lemnae]
MDGLAVLNDIYGKTSRTQQKMLKQEDYQELLKVLYNDKEGNVTQGSKQEHLLKLKKVIESQKIQPNQLSQLTDQLTLMRHNLFMDSYMKDNKLARINTDRNKIKTQIAFNTDPNKNNFNLLSKSTIKTNVEGQTQNTIQQRSVQTSSNFRKNVRRVNHSFQDNYQTYMATQGVSQDHQQDQPNPFISAHKQQQNNTINTAANMPQINNNYPHIKPRYNEFLSYSQQNFDPRNKVFSARESRSTDYRMRMSYLQRTPPETQKQKPMKNIIYNNLPFRSESQQNKKQTQMKSDTKLRRRLFIFDQYVADPSLSIYKIQTRNALQNIRSRTLQEEGQIDNENGEQIKEHQNQLEQCEIRQPQKLINGQAQPKSKIITRVSVSSKQHKQHMSSQSSVKQQHNQIYYTQTGYDKFKQLNQDINGLVNPQGIKAQINNQMALQQLRQMAEDQQLIINKLKTARQQRLSSRSPIKQKINNDNNLQNQ